MSPDDVSALAEERLAELAALKPRAISAAQRRHFKEAKGKRIGAQNALSRRRRWARTILYGLGTWVPD